MRIAVLEWICGSGCESAEAGLSELSDLFDEGWQMLAAVTQFLCRAGHEVEIVLDARLAQDDSVGRALPRLLSEHGSVTATYIDSQSISQTLDQWRQIAARSELSIVIAPEIDGVLEVVVETLGSAGCELLNCSGDFLANTSDKLQTAECLGTSGYLHPPTTKLLTLDEAWLHANGQDAKADWIVKQRSGADCHQLIVSTAPIQLHAELDDLEQWIVQPMISGQNYSQSYFWDRNGEIHRFQAMRQRIERVELAAGQSGLRFLEVARCSDVQPPEITRAELEQIFGDGASGWIGFDWLRDAQDHWWLIECNPRFTTTVAFLDDAGQEELIECFACLSE